MTQTVLLGDICDVRDGTHDSPKPKTEGHPLVTSKHIKNHKIDFSTANLISTEDFEFVNKRSKVDKHDILISMIGTVGELALIDYKPTFAIKNIGLIKTGDKLLGKYLFYYLQSPAAKQYIEASLAGSTQKFIGLGQLRKFPVELPNLATQKKIADILGAIDEKIELNRRMNETLEQMGQALFRHYFIDKKVMKKWRLVHIGDVLSVLESGSRPKGGAVDSGIPSIGAENIDGLGKYDYSKEKYISKKFFDNLKRGKIQSEDVLLYKDGAYVGKKSLFMDGFPHKTAAINEHVFRLRTNDMLPSQFYLYFWLDQSEVTKKIVDAGVKAAQPGINQQDVKRITIMIPEDDSLRKFDDDVRPIMKQIFRNANEIQILTALRDTLLPKFISGEIEV